MQVLTDTSGKTGRGIFFHAWLSIPSGKKVLTPQGKQCCGEVVISAEGIAKTAVTAVSQ